MSAQVDRLFAVDPADAAAPAGEAVESAVALDQKPTLVRLPEDGLLARKVCLHSLDKAHYASGYADIVGTGMKRAFGGPLAWIELFAGPGVLQVKDLDNKFHPGSPVQATSIRDPFDFYVFVDMDPRCVEALDKRVGYLPGVTVLEGDANSADVLDQIVAVVPKNALVILYADPQGLDFDFGTIEFFAERYKHLDLLINLPVPGVDRALSAGWQAKAAKVLRHPEPLALIGPGSGRPGVSVREWYQRQLEGLGYDRFCAEQIRHYEKKTAMYDLVLASRNPKAEKFFSEVQKRGPHGQYRLDFDF
jgi:three-Cys-motif partner protein